MPMKKVLLTLARAGFLPNFDRIDDPRGYTSNIAQICLSLTDDSLVGKSRKEKSRKLREEILRSDFPCPRFLMRKEVSRIKGGGSEEYSLDPNDYDLPSPELPLLIKHSYAFGLFSFRATVPVFLRKDMSIEDLTRGWKGLAFAFHEFLSEQIPSKIPNNRLSNYFAEIYVLEGSLDDTREEEAKMMISPLKEESFSSLFPFSRRDGARDPMVVSTDGILIQLQRLGRKNRDQRRKMRRVIRIAVDIILGQKVFYTSPTLWRENSSSWGAMVGLVYLSPSLWRSRYFHPSRKFYAIYRRIFKPFDRIIEEGYEAYSSGYEKFLEGSKISNIHSILSLMHRLGVTIPDIRVPLLSRLESTVLTMLCLKESLDRSLKGERKYVKEVSDRLCKEFNERDYSCFNEFKKKLNSRIDKRGLSVEEIEVLLGGEYSSPRGIVRKKGVMESLMNLKLVRSCGKITRKGSGAPKVEVYCPEVRSDYVSWLLSLINRRSYP